MQRKFSHELQRIETYIRTDEIVLLEPDVSSADLSRYV